jgi:hypothetical protein
MAFSWKVTYRPRSPRSSPSTTKRSARAVFPQPDGPSKWLGDNRVNCEVIYHLGIAGNDVDGDLRCARARAKPNDQLSPAHKWHHQISHNDIGVSTCPDRIQGGLSIASLDDRIPLVLEDLPEQKADARVVVDDKNRDHVIRRTAEGALWVSLRILVCRLVVVDIGSEPSLIRCCHAS